MEFKIGNFHVKDIVWGEKNSFGDGILTINKDQAEAFVKEDKRVISCELHIVHPGDSVRMVPVKEISGPRCKVTDGEVWPGYQGKVKQAGTGVTYCLRGMAVTSIGHYGSFNEGLLDMSGPGAEECWYSDLIHIAMVMETEDENEEHDKKITVMSNDSLRRSTLRLSEWIAKETVMDLQPDDWDEFRFDPILKRDEKLKDLPKVAFFSIVESNGEIDFMNQAIYGWPARFILPFLMSPTAYLDGAINAHSYHVAGMGTYDIEWMNNPVVTRLCKEHGKTINFVGIVIMPDNADLNCKKRCVMMALEQAEYLGIDGAIVNLTGYGNTYVDYIDTIVGLKEMGIKTVGLSLECCGRTGTGNPYTVMNPKADLHVSCGNISEVVVLPPVETVLGDALAIVRDPSSGSWPEDDPVYGPSLRADGSVACEENYICGGNSSLGWSRKTVKEF